MPVPSAVRETLTARLEELRARVERLEDDLRQPLDDDFGEQAVDREDDEVLDAVEAAALAEIELIEEALVRLDTGTYGLCTACGEEIAPKRLEALPACRFCISCAEQADEADASA
ncbi:MULTISPECIES: TraR/DksA family transcriptional regulator [Sphingobium]|uniref:TraR/DksA family transcriptional regulator n=2 Tax=Sphingobium TaxID=165695 RepID=A0A9X7UEP1_SPHYA|nr:TraR/DksA family transcriptional regulator [Sphingobium yanoikuyae]QNG48752.1 TraR/DksA family transcriptional regulator [Sphingobium yanoikuyae]